MIPADPSQGKAARLSETLKYQFPDRLRSDISWGNRAGFSVMSGQGFVRVIDGRISSLEMAPVDHYTDILLFRDPDALAAQLVKAGINTAKASFRRFDGRICYVIGGQSPDREKGQAARGIKNLFPSLWIEKDTRFPLRYVLKKKGWLVEIQYRNWQQHAGRAWYPMETDILMDGKPAAKIRVRQFEITGKADSRIFEVDEVIRKTPKAFVPDDQPAHQSQESMDELERRIEAFENLYQ